MRFSGPQQPPVHLFVALLSPPQSAALHLKALARVAVLLRDADLRSRLLQAPDAATIHALLVRAEDALEPGPGRLRSVA